MKEIWKPVKGYEGLYEVSNFGRVVSLNFANTGEKRELAQSTNTNGYKQVGLCKDHTHKRFVVHRLVCEAFIENPNGYVQANHKDENKANNTVDNLEWCTHTYNQNYGTRNKRVSEKMTNGKLSKPVIATLSDGSEEYYPSIAQASRDLGGECKGHIWGVIHGTRNTARGRKWRYAK